MSDVIQRDVDLVSVALCKGLYGECACVEKCPTHVFDPISREALTKAASAYSVDAMRRDKPSPWAAQRDAADGVYLP